MVYRACGHDEESGNGTQSNLPIIKYFNKRHWSFAQIFIKWLNGQCRAKTFFESWTLLVINWQFKFFLSYLPSSERQEVRLRDQQAVCVCLCMRVRTRMLYRNVIFQLLDQLIDFHEIKCETYGGRANL